MKKISILIVAVSLSTNMFATNPSTKKENDSKEKPTIEKVEKKTEKSALINYNKSKMLSHFVPAIKLQDNKLLTKSSQVPSLCTGNVGNLTYTVFESQGQYYVVETDSQNRTRRIRDNISIIEAYSWCEQIASLSDIE